MDEIKFVRYGSAAGGLILGSLGERICLCDWVDARGRDVNDRRICRNLGAQYVEGESETIRAAILQLEEYFAGERKGFTMPLLFSGSEFQNSVWEELLKVSYGETLSYGELARRVGNPRGVRAVASAVGANPISIFVPCHRIIGSDGSLTGFAGGLDAKTALLKLEWENR